MVVVKTVNTVAVTTVDMVVVTAVNMVVTNSMVKLVVNSVEMVVLTCLNLQERATHVVVIILDPIVSSEIPSVVHAAR